MPNRFFHLLALCVTLACVPVAHADERAFTRGVAVTDAAALRELDLREQPDAQPSLGLAAMLGASSAFSADIFALPSMARLRVALERELNNYDPGGLQRFDRAALFAPRTRFVLAGIVNRMDRAFVRPETCGEIRLIYRPVTNYGDAARSTKLPMTLNLVLDAKGAGATCAEIAGRWLALADDKSEGVALARKLGGRSGVLDTIAPGQIRSIETNIQIARAASDPNDFTARADYLMKVFDYDAAARAFAESPMENQIDRDRLRADPAFAAEFRAWLLAPDNLAALDRGTVVIPQKFLATRAITVTPAMESGVQGLFKDSDVVDALAKADANGAFENIKSAVAFERRLSDSTCTGCHATRAIGGFHFPGADWTNDAKGMVVASASPHLIGDQPRRRDILGAIRDGKTPDFSRGFAERPQAKRAAELAGTTYVNGWGARCMPPGADASFASWGCADGLVCQMPDVNPRKSPALKAGLCFPKNN